MYVGDVYFCFLCLCTYMFIQQQLGNLCTVHTLVLVTCIHFYIVLHLCGN
jgi:hypothetical protein